MFRGNEIIPSDQRKSFTEWSTYLSMIFVMVYSGNNYNDDDDDDDNGGDTIDVHV